MSERRAMPRTPTFSRVEVSAWDAQAIRDFAMLEDLSAGGMGLRARMPLAVGSPVEVLFRGQRLRGKVRHCARNGIGYFMGIQFMEDAEGDAPLPAAPVEASIKAHEGQRRLALRKPHFSRVEISIATEDKGQHRHLAMMEDWSPGGLGLRVQAALPVGSPIEISLRGQWLRGMIRHCTHDGIGYFVGVQLRQVAEQATRIGA